MKDHELPTLALDAIRTSLPIDSWSKFADVIAKDRRKRQPHLVKSEVDRSWFGANESLSHNGFAKLPNRLPAQTIEDIRRYLDAEPVHKGPHVFAFDGRAKSLEEARREYSMVGYRSDQVMRAPHVVDIFNDPRLIDLIEEYLGCVPTLYSLNGWWSFPANQPELIYSQYFHRDIDDWRFVTLFLYLSDVDETTGPHQVVTGSHTLEGMNTLLKKAEAAGREPGEFNAAASFANSMGEQFSHECERLFSDEIFNATGPAGTMYLVNTTALHRGLVPVASPRLVLWARYGLGPTCNSSNLEHGPIAKRLVPTSLSASPRNRYVNRLLFDFDLGPEY
jgi:Phytanoyl-CoA dioxygenase (PhyH)